MPSGKSISILLFILILSLISTGSGVAQEDVDISIFIDRDSLTVSVTGNRIVSLQGIGFEIERNGKEAFYLENYPAMAGFPFNSTRTPICFRLLRSGTSPALPLDCSPDRTVIQTLAEADVFWYDMISNSSRTVQLLSGVEYVDFCLAGQARCNILYFSPPFTATQVPLPPAATSETLLATETPLPLPTSDAYALALAGVENNIDWTPVIQEFEGVEMVLVPVGCFMMGSENGGDDEKPAHEQCFDTPFWIDRTEVTNAQFAEFMNTLGTRNISQEGYEYLDIDDENAQIQWNGNAWYVIDGKELYPVGEADWFGVRDFCLWRGVRLPTEREWEYAARGVSNWVYPWGNNFTGDFVVYSDNSPSTQAVGGRPFGASWVGALDMSGNISEWVSTLSFSYPYNALDGREAEDSDQNHVIRGGSWWSRESNSLRAAARVLNYFVPSHSVGFRCVRS